MLAMTLFSSYGYVYGNSEGDKAASEDVKAKIYFQSTDGKRIDPDENNTFTLTSLDQGKFIVENAKELGVDQPYFEGAVERKEGRSQWRDVWVDAQGNYHGFDKRVVEIGVYDRSTLWHDAKKLGSFKINGLGANATGLKAFSNGKEISMENPVVINGEDGADIKFKGQFGEGKEYVDIPNSAVKIESKDNGYTYMSESVSLVNNTKPATFEAYFHDKSAKVEFKAISKKVDLESFKITYPKVVYIDQYNGLGEKWIGSTQGTHEGGHSIEFFPANASNQKLNWEALNPEVAEYEYLHGNGIVPKKAGVAKFIVTSEENPKLRQDVELEFKYRHPLEKMEIEKTDYQLKPYEMVNLELNPTPSNATEQRYIWSYSKEGIVKVTSKVSRTGVHDPHVFGHMLSAKKPGTVTVTGTPLDDTAGANKIQFTVTVEGDKAAEDLDYLAMAKEGTKHGVDVLSKSGINAYTNEWNIFSIQRAGGSIGSKNAEAYIEDVASKLDGSETFKITDYARIALAVGALGKDATDVGGHNVIDFITGATNMRSETSNAPIFGLIAINSKNYKVGITKLWNRDDLVRQILKFQKENGSFGLTKEGNVGSVDMTAMALQSLANKYKEGTNTRVNTAVGKALDYLASAMDDDCTFGDNSPSTAQVLTALTSLGIDPTKSTKFSRGNKNLVTSLLEFKNDAGYGISKSDKGSNTFADTQVTYALDSYIRFAEGRPALYDFSDAKEPVDEDIDGNEDGDDSGDGDDGDIAGEVYDFVIEGYDIIEKEVPKDIDYIKNFRVKYDKYRAMGLDESAAEELDSIEPLLAMAEGKVALYESVNHDELSEEAAASVDKLLKEAYDKINNIDENLSHEETKAEVKKIVADYKAKLVEAVKPAGGDDQDKPSTGDKDPSKPAAGTSGKTETKDKVTEIESSHKEAIAEGNFDKSSKLIVEEIDLNKETKVNKAIATEMKKDNAYVKAYDVRIEGKHEGKLKLRFKVAEGLDGHKAEVIHYIGGDEKNVEIKPAVVRGDQVEVEVDSLSPFVVRVLKEKAETALGSADKDIVTKNTEVTTDKTVETVNKANTINAKTEATKTAPATGDNMEMMLFVMATLVVICLLAVAAQRRDSDTI